MEIFAANPRERRIFRFISDPEYLYQVFVEALAVCDPSHPVLRMSLRDRCPPYTPRAPGADKVQASGGAKTQYPEVQDGPKVAAEPLHDRQYRSNYLSQCHQPCKTQSVRSSRRRGRWASQSVLKHYLQEGIAYLASVRFSTSTQAAISEYRSAFESFANHLMSG